MNFDLSEDQELLKALAERFVAGHCDLDRRRLGQASDYGFLPENWALMGELGLIAAPFAPDDGGMGLGASDLATVFEALGRGLAIEPLIENVLVGGCLFAATARGALREAWLPAIVSGERRIALAHAEAGGRGGRLWVETRCHADGQGVVIDGSKPYVPAGCGADGYIVSARAHGTPGDAEGLGLYFVPADAPRLTVTPWRMADGSRAVSIDLTSVSLGPDQQLDAGPDGAFAAIEAVQCRANLARAAEALGVMERIFADTLDYLRTREQFGTPLGSFQAIQHRMALQYAALEQARALVNLAQVSEGGLDFASAVDGARAFIARTSIALGHEMIQFHGGMGVTDELAIGHAHKRLLMLSRWPDDPDAALDRFAGVAASATRV